MQNRIKKLKREIERVEFKGLTIDRSKSQRDIDSQLDISAEGFQKVGNTKEVPERDQFSEGDGYVMPGDGNMDHPHSKMLEWGGREKEERPKRKRREKGKPL